MKYLQELQVIWMTYLNFTFKVLKFLTYRKSLFNLMVHILLCFALFGNTWFCPYPSVFLNWHWTVVTHTPMPVMQTQRMLVNKSLRPARHYGNNKIKTQHNETFMEYTNGSVQDNSNFISNSLELLQSCVKPSILSISVSTNGNFLRNLGSFHGLKRQWNLIRRSIRALCHGDADTADSMAPGKLELTCSVRMSYEAMLVICQIRSAR